MAAQQHKIMRQVLELHGCPADAAAQWQSALRDSYGQRLLPLIEAACSALGSSGRIDRIDRLEIDLGTVPPASLDAALGAQLDACFSAQLAAAIRSAPQGDAALELFSHFIASGCLPWWADADDRGLLDANLQDLLARSPQALRQAVHQALQAAPGARQVLRRLALRYPDTLLGQLAASLAPAMRGIGPAAWAQGLRLIQPIAQAHGQAAGSIRLVWWEEVLRACGSSQATVAPPVVMRAILDRLARRLGSDAATLLTALRQGLQASTTLQGSTLVALIDGLWRDAGGADPARRAHGTPQDAAALDRLRQGLAQWEARCAPHDGLWAGLAALLDRLPATLCARAAAAWSAAPAGADASAAQRDAVAELLRAALAQGLMPAALLARHAAGLQQSPPARQSAAASAAIAASLRDVLADVQADAQTEAGSATGVSEGEDLHLGNAGLVILWPFLATFFKRLGLTDDGQFSQAAAAQRGIGLLQYLASSDADPPEPQLPLNKVLCGLAPEAVFDFGAPLTPAEAEACDDLLAAVIAQAPILQGLSLAGLRASFLLRPGQLSARDGHWLLRVERQTHDIVLDRLPWGMAIVRLPWMAALMQVEW
jgi:hypothetical protein